MTVASLYVLNYELAKKVVFCSGWSTVSCCFRTSSGTMEYVLCALLGSRGKGESLSFRNRCLFFYCCVVVVEGQLKDSQNDYNLEPIVVNDITEFILKLYCFKW